MRRILVLLAVGAALLVWFAFPMGSSPQSSTPSQLETDSLGVRGVPPKPKFVRTMYAVTPLARATAILDYCAGPIAVDLGPTRPVLVVEHDYCGGSAWIPKVKVGDAVELKGDGIDAGIYVVTKIRLAQRHETLVSDLPDTDAVLQTCVSKTKMVLVGLEKFEPTVVS